MASTSKALQDLDPNSKGTPQKRLTQCVGGRLWVPLPLPLVKGHPKDVSNMNAEELRKFFAFAYKSRFNKRLPNPEENECPPEWWIKEIGFDRFLVVKDNANEADTEEFLRSLVIALYKDSGLSFLLTLDAERKKWPGSLHLLPDDESSTIKVVDSQGRTLIGFDKATMNYDAERDFRKLGILGGKENGEEKNSHSEGFVDLPKLRPTRTASAPAASNAYQMKKQAQSAEEKPQQEGTSKKMKLLDSNDKPGPVPSLCKYCSRSFKYQSFCEEHETLCDQGPQQPPMTMTVFMKQLGLYVTKDGPPPKPPVAPPVELPEIYYRQSLCFPEKKKKSRKGKSKKKATPKKTAATVGPSRKASREGLKHQQIVAMFKNNHLISITSTLGQNLIREHANKADTKSPPEYEENCGTSSGSGLQKEVAVRDGEFPDVMKKAIAKDSIDPHIYTCGKGKSQRVTRYNELGVGLGINADKFPLLNQIKPAVVKLVRLNTTTSNIPIDDEDLKNGCLEKKFSGAIELPKVRLVDCMKFPTPESAKYLSVKPAPQPEMAQPSVNNELPNDDTSSDEDEDLFVVVPRKKTKKESKSKESTRSRSSNSNVSSN